MEADWYVDPLGRYEGRYFDGNEWTDQVKEEGRLALDPDWNRPPPEAAEAPSKPQTSTTVRSTAVASTPTVDGDAALGQTAVSARSTASSAASARIDKIDKIDEIDDSDDVVDAEIVGSRPGVGAAASAGLDQIEAEVVTPKFDTRSPKAVEPVIGGAFGAATAPRRPTIDTDFSSESPTRQVAVLSDDSAHAGASDGSLDFGGDSRSKRWIYVLGALALAVALALVLLPRLFGGDADVAEPVEADDVAVQPDDVDRADDSADGPADEGASDLELLPADEGDTPDSEIEAVDGDDTSDDTSGANPEPADTAGEPERVPAGPDSIIVGGLDVLNGKPSLTDLTAWHRSSLGAAAASLPDDATCWFGRLGDAVVQNAHCGPVAASTPEEVRFDLVPLKFEDISDGVIQVRALTDAVISDAALPNGLILVGPGGELDPATFESAPVEEEPVQEEPVEDPPVDADEPSDDEPTESERGGRGSRAVEDE